MRSIVLALSMFSLVSCSAACSGVYSVQNGKNPLMRSRHKTAHEADGDASPDKSPENAALDLVAQGKIAPALDLLGDTTGTADRIRRVEVERATGQALGNAVRSIYGDKWFESPFQAEIHALLLAYEGNYRDEVKKLVHAPIRSVWPVGDETIGVHVTRSALYELLPEPMRGTTADAVSPWRIVHRVEVRGKGDPVRLGGKTSAMLSFSSLQTLEWWKDEQTLHFRSTVPKMLLGINRDQALAGLARVNRDAAVLVARLRSTLLHDAESSYPSGPQTPQR